VQSSCSNWICRRRTGALVAFVRYTPENASALVLITRNTAAFIEESAQN